MSSTAASGYAIVDPATVRDPVVQYPAAYETIGGPRTNGRSVEHKPPVTCDSCSVQGTVPTTAARSTWVWSFTDPHTLIAVTQAADVQRLLVWVSPGFTKNATTMTKLKHLKALTQASGQELDALCGDPSWATNPAASGRWAGEVAGTHLFARLHLDIEPHAAPDWSTDQAQLVSGYLHALTLAGDAGMPVDADIPYWFNTVFTPDGEQLDLAVMGKVASVTLMSYRNSAAAVLKASKPEMSDAAETGTRAYIGVNLAPPGADGPIASFYGQSADDIVTALTQIEEGGSQWASYAGLSLHDSDHLP